MVVTLTFTTTKCQQLTDAELAAVMEACDTIEGLVDTKIKIIEFVESRMSIIAPNLSIVVGSTTAAQLMGSAGGLVALSKIPSCNLPVAFPAFICIALLMNCEFESVFDFFHFIRWLDPQKALWLAFPPQQLDFVPATCSRVTLSSEHRQTTERVPCAYFVQSLWALSRFIAWLMQSVTGCSSRCFARILRWFCWTLFSTGNRAKIG